LLGLFIIIVITPSRHLKDDEEDKVDIIFVRGVVVVVLIPCISRLEILLKKRRQILSI